MRLSPRIHRRPDQVADALGVGKEDAALDAHHQQAGPALVVGVLGRDGPEDVGAALAAERIDGRVIWPGCASASSDTTTATRMPFSVPSSTHAGERDQRPSGTPCVRTRRISRNSCRLDQADRIGDDDRGQRRLRHQTQSAGASNSSVASAAAAVTSSGDLRLGPGGAIDGRLGGAAAGRHRAEQRRRRRWPGRVASSSRFGTRPRLVGLGEGAPGGDGLGEAHQRDADRRRAKAAATSAELRQRERGSPRGTAPTVATPASCSPSSAEAAMAPRHRHQRRRQLRQESLEGDDQRQRSRADRKRRRAKVSGRWLRDRQEVTEEPGLVRCGCRAASAPGRRRSPRRCPT